MSVGKRLLAACGELAMFPDVLAVSTNGVATGNRTFAGPACEVGDLLVGLVSHGTAVASASGWTKFGTKAAPYALSLFHKVADSTSGAMGVTFSASTGSSGVVFRIKKGTFALPLAIGAAFSADSANPPAVSSPAALNAWFAFAGGIIDSGPGYPLPSFRSGIVSQSTSGYAVCAVLDFKGESYDPGGFTGFNASYDRSATIYVAGANA